MAHESLCGTSHEKEVIKWAQKLISNRGFITKDDLIILEWMAKKGDYPEAKFKLIKNG